MNPINLLKKITNYGLQWLLVLGLTTAFTTVCNAGLVGPYPVDGNTLHLWHFDETSGALAFDAVSSNPQTTPMILSNTPGMNAFNPGTDAYFATNGVPSVFPLYNYCIMTTQYSCFYMPWTNPAPASSGNIFPAPAFTNICNYANTNTGAFTMEALVQPGTSLLSGTPVANPEIVCGDNNGNVGAPTNILRGWQWRFDCGAPSAGSAELEFNDINCPGTNHQLIAHLPTTGPDAVVLGHWYHVAVAYTGGAPTNGDPPHVLTMYWTYMDPSRTNCDVLTNFPLAFTYTNGSSGGMLNWNPNTLTTGLYPSNTLHGTPMLCVGGSGRSSLSNDVASAGGFDGLIDEVRISEVYRHSNEMVFNRSNNPAPPQITTQPSPNTLVAYGQTLTVSPTVIGSQPILYQWTQNGVPVAGQTNENLVISNVTFAANGNYELFATNTTTTYGTVGTNSILAAVTVGAGFQNLFNTGVDPHGNPLDQTAPGSVDLHYSLIQNPDPTTIFPDAIVWGDQSPVQPNGVLPANGTAVWIGPEENAGAVTGTYSYQTTFQVDETVVSSAVMSGTLVASGPSSSAVIQAFLNNVETDITMGPVNPFENPVSFVITNGLQTGSNVLQFTMNCTGPGGGSVGLQVQISGIGQALPPGAPIINSEPANQTVGYGGTAGLAVVGVGRPPLSYQWYSNGIAINPATMPSAATSYLTFGATNIISSALDTNGDFDANYQVVVSNSSGSTTSSVVTLTIAGLLPQVAQTPAIGTNTMILYAGANPSFSVTPVSGLEPFGYQWVSNGVDVVGATGEGYGVTNVQAGALSTVNCIVSNSEALVSNLWAVSVIAPPSAPYPRTVLAADPIGYWRLNEPDDGVGDGNPGAVCNDYVGGHDGIYTNVLLGQTGYNTFSDPSETSAEFGYVTLVNSFVGGIEGIDFATPTNQSATFSIEAWVNGYAGGEVNGAGLVTKGYGGGGEQFDLDLFGGDYRFFVHDASGVVHGPTSTVKPDGNWHHVVGVCDEVHSNVSLYVDGVLIGSSSVAPGSGILGSPLPMSIGARMSGTNTAYSYQFSGYLNDVAVYNYALSPAQVLNHYFGSGIPATITLQPTNTTVGQYGTATFTAAVTGTPFLGCQWFDNTGPLAGQTNTTLVLTDVPNSDNADSYYLQVTNNYGTNFSQPVSVSVISGAPQIYVNPPAQAFAPFGGSVSMAVTAYGDEPLAYQWQVSDANEVTWTNLVNGGGITGAQSNVLTITDAQYSDAGNYQVVVSNGSGAPVSSVTTLTVGTLPISFNGTGLGWTGEQSGSYANTPVAFNNGILTLTDGINSEARSQFFNQRQYIGSFKASFTYQFALGSTTVPADGAAFVLQNDPRGAAATGAGGGNLGVGVITPSVELELNLYPSATGGSGYSVNDNGAIGPNKQMGSLVLTNGDPINITVSYAQGQPLSLVFTDAVAHTSYSTNINIGSLTNLLGSSTAYVGFTGGTGGDNAVQTIANFSFISLPLQALQLSGSNTVAISWPGSIFGYVLQQNSDLTTTNWVNVTNLPSVANGLNQVIVPLTSSNAFYRLNLQP